MIALLLSRDKLLLSRDTDEAEGDVESCDALTLLCELHDAKVSDAHTLGYCDVSQLLIRRQNDQLLQKHTCQHHVTSHNVVTSSNVTTNAYWVATVASGDIE